MNGFKYNIPSFAQAIMYADQMCSQMESAKTQALNILNGLDTPLDLDIYAEVSALKSQIETLSSRTTEIKSTIKSLREKIESTDMRISALLKQYIIHNNLLINNGLESPFTLNSYSNNLSKSDLEYLKQHGLEFLYGSIDYGADQGAPLSKYSDGDTKYEEIIKKYFPKMTDEEIVDYLNAMNQHGCGYVTAANYIFEAYLDKPEQFEKDFGFPMYYKDDYGNIKTNVNYLFTDIYAYSHKNELLFFDKTDYKIFYNFKNPAWAYNGSTNRSYGTDIYDRIDILESDRYKNANINLNIIKERYKSGNINDYNDIIKESLDEGKLLNINATDYILYRVDENDNRDYNKIPKVSGGSHAMTITDINENGDYIVSSWGEKFALDPSSIDETFGLAIVEINEGGDNNDD